MTASLCAPGDAGASVAFHQAVALHREGQLEEAAQAYELVLRAEPRHFDALIHLGALRLRQRRAEEAMGVLSRALLIQPDSPEALANFAAALQELGRPDAAIGYYERALAIAPGMQDARYGLAICLEASGKSEAAVTCYEAILRVEPGQAEANYNLAKLLAQLGRPGDAIARYSAAVAADPDFAEANYELGKLLASGNGAEQAVNCFRRALDVDPDYTDARLALGKALLQLDRNDEALAAFHAVLAIEPDHPDALTGIGNVLDRKWLYPEAIEYYRRVLARSPEHPDGMAGMANSLRQTGQHAEALEIARRLDALKPDLAAVASILGRILAEMGSIEEAEAQYRRAVQLAPGRPEYRYHLGQLAKVRREDDTIERLELALADIQSFPLHEQCLLHFALAKAYEDTGSPNRAFAHVLRGNAIQRSGTQYDEAAWLGFMDRIRRVFDAGLIAAHDGQGDPSAVPIFIVGMPRSGTTLVEQILASHPSVYGAGERPELSEILLRLSAARLGAASFPEAVWTMPAEQLRQLGAEYVAALRKLAPDAARITDKMPNNFHFIGMIRVMLPNARVIHVMRDPVDTCLSCFSTLFANGQPFTNDLAELGRYYRAYQRLMAHWRKVLPPGAMLEVEYKALVEDFAAQAERIVTHCGLEWHPACLEFHKTSRPVRTASMFQVRQPVYRSSVGRWRPDPEVLRPLIDALSGDSATSCGGDSPRLPP